MFTISIPKPCHEDWDAMTPNEQGRHCGSCAKTVVDFTGMSDEEVKHFFLNKSERVCGRFMPAQLKQLVIDLPLNIFSVEMPAWKKFLLACLVVFGTTLFSCNTSIDGKIFQQSEMTQLTGDPVVENSAALEMAASKTDTIPPALVGKVAAQNIKTIDPIEIKGDLAFVQGDTVRTKTCERPLMGVPALILVNRDSLLIKPVKTDLDCEKKTYQ